MKYLFLFLFIICSIESSSQSYFPINEYKIIAANSYSKEEITEAIRQLKNEKYLSREYVNSGCNYKSHFVSLCLKKISNIETFKIWNFSKSKVFYFQSANTELKIKDPNGFIEGDTIKWGYHVAVAVIERTITKKKQKLDTLVIDLSLNKEEAIPISLWLSLQNQVNTYYTFTPSQFCNFEQIVPAFYDFSDEKKLKYLDSNQLFNGHFYDDSYSISNKNMAKELARDLIVMRYYREVVLPKINNDNYITQSYQMLEQRKYQKNQMIRGQGEVEFEKETERIRMSISKAQHKYTADIANVSTLQLPAFYKDEIISLTEKIQDYIVNTLKK